MRKTPWEIAEGWYEVDDVYRSLQRAGTDSFGALDKVPSNVQSREFAAWLTHQYRLAMAKGVQLGRDGSDDKP